MMVAAFPAFPEVSALAVLISMYFCCFWAFKSFLQLLYELFHGGGIACLIPENNINLEKISITNMYLGTGRK